MNRNDIAKMYQRANGWSPATFENTMDDLERFASLVVQHEREACAKVCDVIDDGREDLSADCATAIRARGETK